MPSSQKHTSNDSFLRGLLREGSNALFRGLVATNRSSERLSCSMLTQRRLLQTDATTSAPTLRRLKTTHTPRAHAIHKADERRCRRSTS